MISISTPRLFLISLILCFILSNNFNSRVHALGEDSAASAIRQAEADVALAFEAVLEAKGTGTYVSDLLLELNEAAEILARAHNSYRLTDFGRAAYEANLSSQIGIELRVKASARTRYMVADVAPQHFKLTVIVAILGMTVISVASYLSWHFFKRRYFRKISETELEAVSDGH
jgi:hypothetical protein